MIAVATLLWLAGAGAQPPDLPPARARYQYLLASWRLAHGDTAGAVAAADIALFHDPRAAAPRVLKARLAMADGRAEEALRLCNEAVAASPEVASAWAALAEIRALTGDAAGAREADARARALGAPPAPGPAP